MMYLLKKNEVRPLLSLRYVFRYLSRSRVLLEARRRITQGANRRVNAGPKRIYTSPPFVKNLP